MSQGTSSSSEEYQGRLSGAGSRARWSSGCRHRTGISARQLVKSMVIPVVVMCRKAFSNSKTINCHQASEYTEQLKQDVPRALLRAEAHA